MKTIGIARCVLFGFFAAAGCGGSGSGNGTAADSGAAGKVEANGGAPTTGMGGSSAANGHAGRSGGQPGGGAGPAGGESAGGEASAGGPSSVACAPKSLRADINATSNADLEVLAGVTDLTGYVFLSGGVTDISALSCLAHVSGNLALRDLKALTSFTSSQLTSIGGALIVVNDAQLTSVRLPALTKLGADVGRSLWLESLAALTTLDVHGVQTLSADLFFDTFGASGRQLDLNLSSLSSIAGSLTLTSMHFDNADAFLPLRTIKGSVLIRSGDIRDLSGFRGVTEIGRGLTISATNVVKLDLSSLSKLGGGYPDICSVDNLPQLTSLSMGKLPKAACDLTLIDLGAAAKTKLDLDLGSLAAVEGNLRLSRIANLGDLDGLAKLSTVSKQLLVSENPALVKASLPAFTLAPGELSITANNALATVSLPSLTSVGGSFGLVDLARLTAADLPALSTVAGAFKLSSLGIQGDAPLTLHFGSLSKVSQDVTLATLIGLSDLSGFASLAETTGNLAAGGNSQLTSFNLPALTKVGKRLQIADSSTLASITLPKLASVGITDYASLSLSNLPALTTLSAPLLTTTPGDLTLTTVSSRNVPLSLGFDQLGTIGGTLRLDTVRGLVTLSGLSALTTVNNSFYVLDVDTLTSFAGLAKLSTVVGTLAIKDNDALPTCQATALVSHLASTIAGSFVSGNLPDSCSN